MKTKELRELSNIELEKKLHDSREELFNLRCQAKLGQIEKKSNMRKLKKDLARILTVVNEQKKENKVKGV
ncbi:MAG: 50S ribosomal protein L29 [Candidatus Aureabacteria bacterium]|nr:50S ribosomal protein L29 [Candidatus Auribacterota bacterium]